MQKYFTWYVNIWRFGKDFAVVVCEYSWVDRDLLGKTNEALNQHT